VEALASMTGEEGEQTTYDRAYSEGVLDNATRKQKDKARGDLGILEGMNVGGKVDELGYMHGGMPHGPCLFVYESRCPILLRSTLGRK